MQPRLLWPVALAVSIVCLAADATAQHGQVAELAGTVKDASGAMLPKVTLKASSPQLIGGPQAVGRFAGLGVAEQCNVLRPNWAKGQNQIDSLIQL